MISEASDFTFSFLMDAAETLVLQSETENELMAESNGALNHWFNVAA